MNLEINYLDYTTTAQKSLYKALDALKRNDYSKSRGIVIKPITNMPAKPTNMSPDKWIVKRKKIYSNILEGFFREYCKKFDLIGIVDRVNLHQ